MGNMGFYGQDEWSGPNGDFPNVCFKRNNRWKFIIPGISASGVSSLPPQKVGKVGLSFKEIQAEHLNETIYFPSKPDWKPITLTLYDIAKEDQNPVFAWIRRGYDTRPDQCSLWTPCLSAGLKAAQAYLEELDGCGEVLERWILEHIWIQQAEFSGGDMANADVVTCDVTLRYDRAYIDSPYTAADPGFAISLASFTCGVTPSVSMAFFEEVKPVYFAVPTAEFIVIL